MADAADDRRQTEVDSDLVECFVVVVSALDTLAAVATALADLIRSGTIRMLDIVAVECRRDATIKVREVESVSSLATLADVEGEIGGMLSDRDIDRAAAVLEPGSAALLVVAEDRWAHHVSTAARGAGGRIVAGERIRADRVEAAGSGSEQPTHPKHEEDDDDAARGEGA